MEWTPIVPIGRSRRTGAIGSTIERANYLWKVRLRGPVKRCMVVLTTVLSLGIAWLEITIPIPSTTARLSWLYYLVHSTSGMGVQILSMIPFVYMALCTYYSLFCLKVFNFYALHGNQQTEGPSLLFNAALLCRLVAPLSFNYLTCIDENLDSSFQRYMGEMDTVPLLGESFNLYVPIFITIFMLCTACNLYRHCAKLCPGVQQFSFRASDDATHENIEDGQNMLRRERVSRERKYASTLEARQHEGRGESQKAYDKVTTHSDMDGDHDPAVHCGVSVVVDDEPSSLFDKYESRTQPSKSKRSSLEAYYKNQEATSSKPASSSNQTQLEPSPYSEPSFPDASALQEAPASRSRHQFGQKPGARHTFGGGTKYDGDGS
eukprot:TRINITY_DN1326_c0_g1_i3.p1 TRINITY_DN1326_c0_g1~~TRINITY_DN1326_c0_g1_i3.p1  ORF type:complete len:377 (-),score=75.61 TRINITY_DN1326_c0_g1_i3:296-1426(-)